MAAVVLFVLLKGVDDFLDMCFFLHVRTGVDRTLRQAVASLQGRKRGRGTLLQPGAAPRLAAGQ
ncbi:MAG TPA: hypothetical protein VEZ89_09475, partial [Rubrivivax sp.]|nr:hypothetical protein [Rubrivivax sp.]